LELDTKAEEEAIMMYKGIIDQAMKENDVTTAFIFKKSWKTKRSTTTSSPPCSKKSKKFRVSSFKLKKGFSRNGGKPFPIGGALIHPYAFKSAVCNLKS